jgi:hypothetical protein
MMSNVVILPVKAKKHNGDADVDPLFHANRTVVHQKNPIVPPRIWEKSRVSTQESKAFEFEDTYGMVCNNPSAVLATSCQLLLLDIVSRKSLRSCAL